MQTWKTLSSKVIHTTPWIKLIEDTVLTHTNKELTYTYLKLDNPSVFIVAVNEAGQILLQQNYRYTLGKKLWEIPAGHVDSGESPLEAAKRELLEESGLTSESWESLGEMYMAVSVADVHQYIYLARNVRKTHENVDEDEPITNQHFKNQSDVQRMLVQHKIISAGDALALYRYLDTIKI